MSIKESAENDIFTGDKEVETYVAKNQYGYNVVGLIIDRKNKRYQLMDGQQMPIHHHKKITKPKLYKYADMLDELGFERVHGTGDISYGK